MIDKKEWEILKQLSKLQFTEQEEAELMRDMNRTLRTIGMLEESKSDFPVTVVCEPREDEITASLPQEEVLENAPSAENGFFICPGGKQNDSTTA